MIISAKQYWRVILKECIEETNIIPEKYYYLITWNKALQKHIDEEVLKEFISDEENIDMLINEDFYHGLDDDYITQSIDTNDFEDIIKKVYEVTYIDDEYIEITRKAV